MDQAVEKKFWLKVDKGEQPGACWEWRGARRETGYGLVRINGALRRAHRVSWEIRFGVITGDYAVCHKCDNPPCVNPDHLFLGSAKDNTNDCIKKQRFCFAPLGSDHPKAKLTADQAAEIRSMSSRGFGYRRLAKTFGVSQSAIRDLVQGKTWKGAPSN